MKNVWVFIALSLCLSACTFTTDEGYIRCLQGFNDTGSGVKVPPGAAAQVIGAGTVGAAAALILCKEPEITESPDALVAEVPGDLSQPLEERRSLVMTDATPAAAPATLAPVTGFVFDSRTLQFDLDRVELKPGASDTLSPVVDFLNDYPEVSVRITGHTCWLGSNEHNLDLSQRRADAVANYLVSQGIDRDRLFVAAEGESQPLDTNLTEDGRRSNRRVEVVQL